VTSTACCLRHRHGPAPRPSARPTLTTAGPTVLRRPSPCLVRPIAGAAIEQGFRLQWPGRLRLPQRPGHRTAARFARHGHNGQRSPTAPSWPRAFVFFGRKGRVNHVGIYLGDGRFVHAPSGAGCDRLELDAPVIGAAASCRLAGSVPTVPEQGASSAYQKAARAAFCFLITAGRQAPAVR
jgi:hypothetical protein